MKSDDRRITQAGISTRSVLGLGTAALCLFALCYGLLGPTVSLLGQAFGLGLPQQGSLMTAYAFGYLLIVVFGGSLADSFGKGRALSAALLLMGTGMLILAASRGYVQGLIGMAVVGGGGGLAEMAVSSMASDALPDDRGVVLNLMHVVFALSAVSPLLLNWQLGTSGEWRRVYWGIGGLITILSPMPVVLRWGTSGHPDRASITAFATLLRRPRLWALAIGQALYVSSELGVASWAITYLATARGIGWDRASGGLSLFWVCLSIGRLACALLAGRLALHVLLATLAAGATLGLVAVLVLPLGSAAWIVIGATGLFFGGMFATNLAYAGNTYPEYSGTAFGLIAAISALGGLVAPWVMGLVAELTTIHLAFAFVAIAMLGNVIIFMRLGPAVPDQFTLRTET